MAGALFPLERDALLPTSWLPRCTASCRQLLKKQTPLQAEVVSQPPVGFCSMTTSLAASAARFLPTPGVHLHIMIWVLQASLQPLLGCHCWEEASTSSWPVPVKRQQLAACNAELRSLANILQLACWQLPASPGCGLL